MGCSGAGAWIRGAYYVVAVEHFYWDTESLIVSGYDAVLRTSPGRTLPESAEIDVEVETERHRCWICEGR